MDLLPAPFDQDVTALAVFPFVSDPHSVRTRRLFPSSADPDVSVPVPAMIAGNPDIVMTRANRTFFNHRMRWRNRYENFLGAGCEAQPGGKKECCTKSTHRFIVACYAYGVNSPHPAGVAELADARDSKSRDLHWSCGFDPHLQHQFFQRLIVQAVG